MFKYYEVKAINVDGDEEVLFGSYVRADANYELESEYASWKDEGYKGIGVRMRLTAEAPDSTVYTAEELAQSVKEDLGWEPPTHAPYDAAMCDPESQR